MGFLSTFQKRYSSERQHPVERFSAILSTYLLRLETEGGNLPERNITLIARSPAAAAARALVGLAKELERQHVSVQIIFAKLAPVELLIELASSLKITPREHSPSAIRFIKNPSLLNAHEQLIIGTSTCWTGDMLRRSEEQRNGLDLLEENAPGSVRLAEFAFNAIWNIAKPAPARAFTTPRRLFQAPSALPPVLAAAELAGENSTPIRRTTRVLTRH
jgi:hypothetical protein